MANPTPGGIDKARLARLLDRFEELEKAGAAQRSHKDYYEREGVLDDMQQMLGLGMVMISDITSKAKKALGRA